MVKKLVLSLIVFTAITTKAQVVPNIDWAQPYSDRNFMDNVPTTLDANNNVYSTGYTHNGLDRDLIVLKYDSLGNLLVNDNYAGTGDDYGNAIKVDAAGNFYVTGSVVGSGNDVVTIMYDNLGNRIWDVTYDRASSDDEGVDIQFDGTYVYVLCTTSNGVPDKDISVLQYDYSGNLITTFDYDAYGFDDIAIKFAKASNGDLLIVGNCSNGSNTEVHGLRLDNTIGGLLAQNTFFGTGSGDHKVSGIIIDSNDDLIFSGVFNNSGTNDDYFTIKSDLDFNPYWQADYDVANGYEYATSLALDSTNNIAVTGYVNNLGIYEYHTLFYDGTSGSQLWSAPNIENTGIAGLYIKPNVAIDTIAHHVYVSGARANASNDVTVYQITPSGTTSWVKNFDGPANGHDAATGLVVNGIGVIYLSSLCTNTASGFDITTIKISQTPVYFPIDPDNEPYSNERLYFKNKGQLIDTSNTLVPYVKYYNHTSNFEYYVQNNMASYVFRHADTIQATTDSLERMNIEFFHSNPLAEIYEFEPAGIKSNYLLAHCGTDGIMNVEGHAKLLSPNIYPGIDLHYSSNREGVKYFFVCKPNVDPEAINLLITGAQSATVNSGNLLLAGLLGTVNVGSVKAYNAVPLSMTTLTTVPVSVSWQTISPTMFKFAVSSYTAALPLVIMVSVPNTTVTAPPLQNLEYSTFYGGPSNEYFTAITVNDNTNNRYIAGYTIANSFPTFNSAFPYIASWDAVLLKYSGTDSLRFATFYGGSGYDESVGVEVKSNGNIYLVGTTWSTDLNIKTSIRTTADQQTLNGQSTSTLISVRDNFILELSELPGNFIAHKWSRYLGGAGVDVITDIALDNHDNLYLVGESYSCNYPKKNSLKNSPSQCQFGTNADMVITKMDSTCTLVFSTYYGGDATIYNSVNGKNENRDLASGIDVDTLGHIWVTGSAYGSTDMAPINVASDYFSGSSIIDYSMDGNGAILMQLTAPSNTPVVRLYTEVMQNGTTLNDVKVMPDQTALICGVTTQTLLHNPMKAMAGSYYRFIPTGKKGFFSWIDTATTNFWTTHFMREIGSLSLNRIAVSDDGGFYLSGDLAGDSLVYPASTPANVYVKSSSVGQNTEAFISYFSSKISGFQLQHSHFLGGWGNNSGTDIDVYKNSALYITGHATTTDYPVAFTAPNQNLVDVSHNGGYDGVITRFDLAPVVVSLKESTKDDKIMSVTSYPNPVSDLFYINTSELKDQKINNLEVYNLAGQLIYKDNFTTFNEDLLKVNCSSWTSGMYIITITTAEKRYSSKVIKQ